MARYFYDYSIGASIVHDADGVVCRDDKAAFHNGQTVLSGVLSRYQKVLPWQHFEVIVRREDGAIVGRMGMTLVVEAQNPATVAALAAVGNENGHDATTRP